MTLAQTTEKIQNKFFRLHNTVLGGSQGKYLCPVCGQRVCFFLKMSVFYAENQRKHGYPYSLDDAETQNHQAYECPHCRASDRDRLYALYISKRLRPSDAIDLLEIAPSKPLSAMLKQYGKISLRTADLMMPGVDDHIDITDMACYGEARFDAFICSHVLEHVPDDAKALRELHRILKPGGWGILMVPVIPAAEKVDEDPDLKDEAERWRRFGQYDHIRLYSKKGLLERIAAAGFRTRQYGQDYFGAESFWRHGLSPKSVLYVVEKQ
jgi:SAM-dependent methyltransferase